MKKTTTFFLFIATILVAACGTKVNPPASVKTSFDKQFPGVSAKWEKEDGNYEAMFTSGKQEMSATFEENGTMIESEAEIAVTELPASVRDYISKNYNGATIKEASKITLADGTVQYEAAIKGKDVIFDASGSFLKEVVDE